MDLVGSNPVFGLNALGGALSVRMKNGFTYQGGELDLLGGSFAHYQGNFQYGIQSDKSQPMSRRPGCTKAAGVTCNPPISATSTAIWAGAAIAAKSISMSPPRRHDSTARDFACRTAGGQSQRAVHGPKPDHQPKIYSGESGGSYDINDTTSLQGLAYYTYLSAKGI